MLTCMTGSVMERGISRYSLFRNEHEASKRIRVNLRKADDGLSFEGTVF